MIYTLIFIFMILSFSYFILGTLLVLRNISSILKTYCFSKYYFIGFLLIAISSLLFFKDNSDFSKLGLILCLHVINIPIIVIIINKFWSEKPDLPQA
tara:strand:+ start:124 stop:414 length:291 start_codon:yes stop_codon:yes gene_type:complete